MISGLSRCCLRFPIHTLVPVHPSPSAAVLIRACSACTWRSPEPWRGEFTPLKTRKSDSRVISVSYSKKGQSKIYVRCVFTAALCHSKAATWTTAPWNIWDRKWLEVRKKATVLQMFRVCKHHKVTRKRMGLKVCSKWRRLCVHNLLMIEVKSLQSKALPLHQLFWVIWYVLKFSYLCPHLKSRVWLVWPNSHSMALQILCLSYWQDQHCMSHFDR